MAKDYSDEIRGVLGDCLPPDELDTMHAFWGELDGLLNDSGVTYWADGGTLIGAVRHEGVIPWDDDIDIALPAESRERLELSEWRLKDAGFVLDWDRSWPKIWHDSGRKIPSQHHKWPFVDLFFLEEREARGTRTKGYFYSGKAGATWPNHTYHPTEVMPLQRAPFGDHEIWVPNKASTVLDRNYPTWRTVANSGAYDHRRERHKHAFEAPLAQVASAYEQRFGKSMCVV